MGAVCFSLLLLLLCWRKNEKQTAKSNSFASCRYDKGVEQETAWKKISEISEAFFGPLRSFVDVVEQSACMWAASVLVSRGANWAVVERVHACTHDV